ncbi:hypothetical protein GIB67_028082 [Kingdonia uniflora]|uniref:Uncharacterized protein n=1 Tax=Kingdonia uniflora TaxID=39325 RepID=A0A7J7MBN8_9MAGN|nr:hypothetical protein GIB67_028082 [Kingdonia uniflora]
MLQLHKEILDFCDFLSPTQEEQSFRNAAVEGVFDCIKYIWPHCEVEVFGSFKTGLYLPTSDIDKDCRSKLMDTGGKFCLEGCQQLERFCIYPYHDKEKSHALNIWGLPSEEIGGEDDGKERKNVEIDEHFETYNACLFYAAGHMFIATVVILDSKVRTPQIGLQALSRALSQKGIAKKIQVIAKARVPIVKFIEKRSNIAFDISFDVQNGPKAAEFIKISGPRFTTASSFLSNILLELVTKLEQAGLVAQAYVPVLDAVTKIPPLRPLCLILKVFLQQRELNEVYSGGIGSYALLTMLIAQLQIHWKGQYFQGPQASLEHNLGVLLINFFEFYGRKLNVWDVGVSCKESGTFYLKNTRGFLNSDRPFLLSIEDPQASENDIGRSSFNYSQIRSAFGMAFSTLTSSKTILGLGVNKSILGTIIRPDPILLERKGGLNGDVTFDKLLPGAGEVVQTPFQDEQGSILCNWQFNEDEPFPRSNGNLGEVSTVHSSRKRKKEKRKSSLKESNEHMKIHGEENGSSKKGKKKKSAKKRWKNHNDEQVFGGISHVNGPPWTRSCSR